MSTQRRRRRPARAHSVLVGVLLTALVAGCGSSSDDADDAVDSGDDGSSSDSSSAGDFPITVETSHGEVTISEEPERVVALTPQAAGGLLELGINPVKVYSDAPAADFADWYPWLDGKLGDDILDPDLYADKGPNAEAIAAAEPDLIVVSNWFVEDKADFDRLNQIAPTVGSVGTALNPDWDEVFLAIGEAVGKRDEAEAVVDEVAAEFTAVGDKIPDISSKTYQSVRADEGSFAFGNGAVLELFGMIPADNQDNTMRGAPVSAENTDQLDADLLMIWPYAPEARERLENSPLFQELPSVRNGTVVFSDIALANAINAADPLSLRWVKERVAPTIEALAPTG